MTIFYSPPAIAVVASAFVRDAVDEGALSRLPPVAVVVKWSVSVWIGVYVGHDVVEMRVWISVAVVVVNSVTSITVIWRPVGDLADCKTESYLRLLTQIIQSTFSTRDVRVRAHVHAHVRDDYVRHTEANGPVHSTPWLLVCGRKKIVLGNFF